MANPAQIGQGGVIYNEAALIATLLAQVGTTSDLLDATAANTFLEDARVEINRRKPLVILGQFDTEAEKQIYTPAEANFPATWTGGKPFIFWRGGSSAGGTCPTLPLGPYNWSPGDVLLSSLYGGSAITEWEIDRAISQYNFFLQRFGARGWVTAGNQVLLSPQPTAVDTVYYLIPTERFATITDIDISFRDAFFARAIYGAASYLAALQGEIASSEGPDGKKVATAAGVRWRQQADAAINRFEHLMVGSGAGGPMLARLHPGPRFV